MPAFFFKSIFLKEATYFFRYFDIEKRAFFLFKIENFGTYAARHRTIWKKNGFF